MNSGPVKGLLTSVPLATLQLGLLATLACTWRTPLPLCLALLGAAMLTVAWSRRPYDRARLGFLLVHGGGPLLALGLWGPRWLAALGLACLALGLPWMFYLKPLLKARKEGAPRPAWERATLQGTRLLFLGLGAALVPPALGRAPLQPWMLAAWLLLAGALHVHHIKAWKGRRAQFAGLAAWGLGGALYLLRGLLAPG